MSTKEYWGNTDTVFQCLVDTKRLRIFKNAIFDAVKKNSVVVDLGSGSGILSLFALRAGAKKVYAVELDPILCGCIEKTKKIRGIGSRLTVINADARHMKLPEKVDVVICEMIATGMFDEAQIPVINNIKRFCSVTTLFLPQAMRNYASLVNYDNSYSGETLNVIAYDYYENSKRRATSLTQTKEFSYIDFIKPQTGTIKIEIPLNVKRNGTINGLRISSYADFPNHTRLGNTFAFCMPLILPLGPLKVTKGESYNVKFEYKLCKGLQHVNYVVSKL